MAKFNKPNTIKTTNESGYPAYSMSDKEHLVTAVLTTMFGEPKYYGSTDNDIVKLATDCAHRDPDFLCRLACYARNEGNLRSVSHVLTAVIAREASEYTRQTVRNVVVRADDMTEIMACYLGMYGKPFPNALKRAMAEVFQRFDEYQLAKYNGNGKSMKFRDILRITHPVPGTQEKAELFRRVLDDTLATPYTWETELSARGNTGEVWNELIASGKLGYMAMLRNLRNMVKCGADITPVLARLADPGEVLKSRQLPFRFFSAYRKLEQEHMMTPAIHQALESAVEASVANLPVLTGRTLIAVDCSGSMGQGISAKSEVRCCDVAALCGAMAGKMCEDATVCYFDNAGGWHSMNTEGYRIAHYGKYDSVLSIATKTSFAGGGTDMSLPMIYALEKDETRNVKPFDRIIYFSDNECNRSVSGYGRPIQGFADQYRAKYNPGFWVHAVDMQGYGTKQFCGDRFNLIAGWGDEVFRFIGLAEAGVSTLVKTIGEYPVA